MNRAICGERTPGLTPGVTLGPCVRVLGHLGMHRDEPGHSWSSRLPLPADFPEVELHRTPEDDARNEVRITATFPRAVPPIRPEPEPYLREFGTIDESGATFDRWDVVWNDESDVTGARRVAIEALLWLVHRLVHLISRIEGRP